MERRAAGVLQRGVEQERSGGGQARRSDPAGAHHDKEEHSLASGARSDFKKAIPSHRIRRGTTTIPLYVNKLLLCSTC